MERLRRGVAFVLRREKTEHVVVSNATVALVFCYSAAVVTLVSLQLFVWTDRTGVAYEGQPDPRQSRCVPKTIDQYWELTGVPNSSLSVGGIAVATTWDENRGILDLRDSLFARVSAEYVLAHPVCSSWYALCPIQALVPGQSVANLLCLTVLAASRPVPCSNGRPDGGLTYTGVSDRTLSFTYEGRSYDVPSPTETWSASLCHGVAAHISPLACFYTRPVDWLTWLTSIALFWRVAIALHKRWLKPQEEGATASHYVELPQRAADV